MNKTSITSRLLALAAATCLTCACATTKLPMYDPRPDNDAPELVKPQAADYDINDSKTFATYKNVYTVTEPDGIMLFHGDHYRLYRTKDATYVTATYLNASKRFYLFNSQCAIIDSKTGDQYMLRRVEHFPLDKFFWVEGSGNGYIRFVLVFPPLPADVEKVDFFSAGGFSRKWFDGSAECWRNISVEKLRRGNGKKSERIVPKRGRIIY